MPAVRLPAKMCAECHRSSVTASKFSDKCHRAFEKLERSGVRGAALVWGQGQSLLERQRQVVSAGGGVEYNKKIHGQLKFPRINLSKEDRARAEDHKARSETKRRQETWQTEVEPDKEMFPSVGPFQCEMCQLVTATKQDFVTHIKTTHQGFIDPDVLRGLESDLRVREKLDAKKQEKSKARPVDKTSEESRGDRKAVKDNHLARQSRRRWKSKKSEKRKNIVESDSDEEFRMSTKKMKMLSFSSGFPPLQYIDEDGNKLPKAAGKFQGTSICLMDFQFIMCVMLSGLCNVCGKVLGRANEMFKHQQSLSCRTVAREKGQACHSDGKSVMVVLVKNYVGPKLDSTPSQPLKPDIPEIAPGTEVDRNAPVPNEKKASKGKQDDPISPEKSRSSVELEAKRPTIDQDDGTNDLNSNRTFENSNSVTVTADQHCTENSDEENDVTAAVSKCGENSVTVEEELKLSNETKSSKTKEEIKMIGSSGEVKNQDDMSTEDCQKKEEKSEMSEEIISVKTRVEVKENFESFEEFPNVKVNEEEERIKSSDEVKTIKLKSPIKRQNENVKTSNTEKKDSDDAVAGIDVNIHIVELDPHQVLSLNFVETRHTSNAQEEEKLVNSKVTERESYPVVSVQTEALEEEEEGVNDAVAITEEEMETEEGTEG